MENDKALRREFAEMVQATERAAAQIARPWKVATLALATALVAVCWKGKR